MASRLPAIARVSGQYASSPSSRVPEYVGSGPHRAHREDPSRRRRQSRNPCRRSASSKRFPGAPQPGVDRPREHLEKSLAPFFVGQLARFGPGRRSPVFADLEAARRNRKPMSWRQAIHAVEERARIVDPLEFRHEEVGDPSLVESIRYAGAAQGRRAARMRTRNACREGGGSKKAACRSDRGHKRASAYADRRSRTRNRHTAGRGIPVPIPGRRAGSVRRRRSDRHWPSSPSDASNSSR